jgi:hypothetical protein
MRRDNGIYVVLMTLLSSIQILGIGKAIGKPSTGQINTDTNAVDFGASMLLPSILDKAANLRSPPPTPNISKPPTIMNWDDFDKQTELELRHSAGAKKPVKVLQSQYYLGSRGRSKEGSDGQNKKANKPHGCCLCLEFTTWNYMTT